MINPENLAMSAVTLPVVPPPPAATPGAPVTPALPSAKVIHVDTRGAVILSEESPEVRRSRSFCDCLHPSANLGFRLDKRQSRNLPAQLHRTSISYRRRCEFLALMVDWSMRADQRNQYRSADRSRKWSTSLVHPIHHHHPQ
jgi:hypothetical protein